MKISGNELDLKFFVDMAIALVMFFLGIFWDYLPMVRYAHIHNGYGLLQMGWITFWGIYGLFTYFYWIHYGE